MDAIVSAYMGWIENPSFNPFLPVLWDVRRHSVRIAARDFMRLPERTNQVTGKRRAGMRTAVLVDSVNAEFVAKTIAGHHEWAVDIRVFRDEDAARRWLRGTADEP